MPEIMNDFQFSQLEQEAHRELCAHASQELLARVENDPPLRLHVRAAAPARVRLEKILNLSALNAAIPDDLQPRRWLAPLLDHTLLRPSATDAEIESLCVEARKLELGAVCVSPTNIAACKHWLRGSKVGVISVVAFPSGCHSPAIKSAETAAAIADGAQEVDMVIAVGKLKSREYDYVFQDILNVITSAQRCPVKAILECVELSDVEKLIGAWLARAAGAHYVKTSTGFSSHGGATAYDVSLLRRAVGSSMGVKASGGIKTMEEAIAMIMAGADRIGTSASAAMMGMQ